MQNNFNWQFLAFSELSTNQLYAILHARSEVFVIEQNCPYQDMDGCDQASGHLIAWADDGAVAAYLRVVPPGLKYPEASLGRVITSKFARGTGIGKELLNKGISACKQAHPEHAIRIGAQHYLEKFYQSFGFETVSEIYLEDEIPHVEMLLK
jgi:ElaA protein